MILSMQNLEKQWGYRVLVYDVEGNQIEWKVKGQEITVDKRSRSALHKQARIVISDRFPALRIIEEVPIPVRPKQTLFLDFYLPLRKLAIEVHGEQHYKYIAHFYKTPLAFAKQRRRDREKVEWCEQNGIEMVILPYNTIDDWENLIR